MDISAGKYKVICFDAYALKAQSREDQMRYIDQ